jgi:hypothetical protein
MAFVWGFVGAAVAEYLRKRHLRNEPRSKLPASLTETHYWVMTGIECVIGGGAAYLYSDGTEIGPLLGINVGAAWPLLLDNSAASIEARRPRDEEVD